MTLAEEGCEAIEQVLVTAAKYSGNQQSHKKQLSASQLGNDDLQIYLKYMHGGKDSSHFEANTFGSIYHLGAEVAFKDIPGAETEVPLQYALSNGWLITGTVDLLWDKYKMIADHKTTTATSIGSTVKDGKHSSHGLQMAVYQWLLWKNRNISNYTAVLPMVDKSFSYFKKNKYNQLNFIIIDTHSMEDIEQMLLDKTNQLQQYIDLEQQPPECENLFWYGPKGGRRKKMRCLHYCDQADHCDAFQNGGQGAKAKRSELLDLL